MALVLVVLASNASGRSIAPRPAETLVDEADKIAQVSFNRTFFDRKPAIRNEQLRASIGSHRVWMHYAALTVRKTLKGSRSETVTIREYHFPEAAGCSLDTLSADLDRHADWFVLFERDRESPEFFRVWDDLYWQRPDREQWIRRRVDRRSKRTY